MSWLANVIGSGACAIAIVVAWLIGRHMHHAPAFAQPWLRRAVIVLMYAGGAALAVTELGRLADSLIVTVAGWFGGLSYGFTRALVVAALLILLAGVLFSLIWEPDDASAMVAIVLPLLLALPLGGLMHEVYAVLDGPAASLASALNHALAG